MAETAGTEKKDPKASLLLNVRAASVLCVCGAGGVGKEGAQIINSFLYRYYFTFFLVFNCQGLGTSKA